uniref:Uncharacterized protein n=1 Tax=Arundo donax TaxID=35708 RepID=A0A0A9B3H7_ARUDO
MSNNHILLGSKLQASSSSRDLQATLPVHDTIEGPDTPDFLVL